VKVDGDNSVFIRCGTAIISQNNNSNITKKCQTLLLFQFLKGGLDVKSSVKLCGLPLFKLFIY